MYTASCNLQDHTMDIFSKFASVYKINFHNQYIDFELILNVILMEFIQT